MTVNEIFPENVRDKTDLLGKVLFFILFIALYNAAINNACLDVLAMSLMGIAVTQLDIFNEKVKKFKNWNYRKSMGTNDFLRYLNECVKHHNEIIRYVENIEEVFSFIFLVQYMTSAAVICNIGFQLVHIHPLSVGFARMVFYIIAMMCQLGMYCWYGNEIIVKVSRMHTFNENKTTHK
ncbi:hypothetical protein NQ315_006616 [Exocentrus adspersus]|uniref:Uncharacterized protein n=1 Tax=Exocentrus adspersus TaxID=1586481 RepID=A0AAV8VF27_9CUCU|nr:hypothetical protein NQ315_006616 [Exocentrus adspersus]